MPLENLLSRNIFEIDENQFKFGNYSIVFSSSPQQSISSSSDILIRQTIVGGSIEYSLDNGQSWLSVVYGNIPIKLINSGLSNIIVKLTNNITFNTPTSNPPGPGENGYFIIGSTNITFDGNNKIVTINNLNNYIGLIQNGTNTNNGYSNIIVKNLGVVITNTSTLGVGCGFIGQAYFSRGATNNLITKCYSIGEISGEFAGGICGTDTGSNNGNLSITNCYTNGNITNSTAGGICGANAGSNNGIVTITNCFSSGSGSGSNGIFGDNKQITATQIYCYSAYGSWNDSKARKNLQSTVPVPNNPIGTIWADSDSNNLNVPYIFASYGSSPYSIPSATLKIGETSQTANVTNDVVYSIIAIAKNGLTNRPSGYPFIIINSKTGAITVTKNNLPSSGTYTLYIYQNFLNGAYTVSTFNLTISPIPNIPFIFRTFDISKITFINTPIKIKLKAIVLPYLVDKTNFVIKTFPKNGKAILVNNVVEYIPNKNYTGSDSFTYYCSYININSNISTVSIKIDKIC